MSVYLITWHDSDGNDCTVYDTIIGAKSQDAALNKLHADILAQNPEAEEDGNHIGFYWPCDCSEKDAELCEGHGGTSLRDVQVYRSYEQAKLGLSIYHSAWEVS